MASIPLKVFKAGVVRHGLVLQLLLCHSLIVLVAIISGGQWLFVLGACLLSFLLLLNIPYNFYTLEIMLARLARNMPVEPDALRLHWPLAYLFTFVKMIDQQSGQQIQVELRNNTYRDQLLQQVSRAAAQEERNRLARDLHDSIKQQIFSIAVSAAAAERAGKIISPVCASSLRTLSEPRRRLRSRCRLCCNNCGQAHWRTSGCLNRCACNARP